MRPRQSHPIGDRHPDVIFTLSDVISASGMIWHGRSLAFDTYLWIASRTASIDVLERGFGVSPCFLHVSYLACERRFD
jgi:hypothetical protein